ncbi:hypothetical protein BJ912DRAFT_1002037 [Pholiota molesta]|nr:hypothetical protein BJ912DRAFT_1002037 [Pholiota molesta]
MNELLPSVPILYMSTFNFADLSTACISSSEAKTSPNVKTVLISVIKEGGGIEYAIAPLKTSCIYCFEALKNHLGNLTPDDISLKMGAKDVSGKLVWASVAPSLWMQIVSEGTELRIFPNSTPAIPTQAAEPSAKMYEDPRPLITIQLPASVAKNGRPFYLALINPKSYDELRTLAFNLLKDHFIVNKSSWKDVILRGLIIEEGTQEDSSAYSVPLSAYGTGESPEWMHLITQLKKEHPSFKILIF